MTRYKLARLYTAGLIVQEHNSGNITNYYLRDGTVSAVTSGCIVDSGALDINWAGSVEEACMKYNTECNKPNCSKNSVNIEEIKHLMTLCVLRV